MTVVAHPSDLDIVAAEGGRRSPVFVFVGGLLVVAAVMARVVDIAGEQSARAAVDVSAVLLEIEEIGPSAVRVARIRLTNDGPLPVWVSFRGIGLPDGTAQAVAGADRVDPAEPCDVTLPLATSDERAALGAASVDLDVQTADGRSHLVTLPLR